MPAIPNPLAGFLGTTTASFFRLNAFGIPVQLILDLDPSFTPDRVKFDMIDSESASLDFTVTMHPLQDFTSATSNVHQEPVRIEVVGTLISSINLGLLGSVGIGALPGLASPLRRDLAVIENLKTIAKRREPIMYTSPRESLSKAFIENITPTWDPSLGENSIISVTLVEAVIVDPLTSAGVVLDIGNSLTGNNAVAPAGAQSGTPVVPSAVQNSTTPGVAPLLQLLGLA